MRGEAYFHLGRLEEADIQSYVYTLSYRTDEDIKGNFDNMDTLLRLYAAEKKYQSILDLFDRFPALIDGKLNQQTVYYFYDWSCTANMALGKTKRALDDCNMSLSFKSNNSAKNKKKQLLKMLH